MATGQQNENNTAQLPQETQTSVDHAMLRTGWVRTKKFSATKAKHGLVVQKKTTHHCTVRGLPQKQTQESEIPRG